MHDSAIDVDNLFHVYVLLTFILFSFFSQGKTLTADVGLGESVVLKLSESLKGTCCTLFFDNFFSGVQLVKTLLQDKILCCGNHTIKQNESTERFEI